MKKKKTFLQLPKEKKICALLPIHTKWIRKDSHTPRPCIVKTFLNDSRKISKLSQNTFLLPSFLSSFLRTSKLLFTLWKLIFLINISTSDFSLKFCEWSWNKRKNRCPLSLFAGPRSPSPINCSSCNRLCWNL